MKISLDEFNATNTLRLSSSLQNTRNRLVLAESCTAGLIAASLGRVPGISEWLAGSTVVYQIESKALWLGVDRKALLDPGPVSQVVSEQMAIGVLKLTPHATIAASVTGHLGPDAPADQDGIAWSSVAVRADGDIHITTRKLQLDGAATNGQLESDSPIAVRHRRQNECAGLVMRFCADLLQGRVSATDRSIR